MQQTLRHIILILAAATLATLSARAQSDMQYSQYYEVMNLYNPGAIGTTDLLKIRAGSRMQWVGIDNAPKSFVGAADMPLKVLGKRIGIGVITETESYGLYSSMQLAAQGAYKFRKFGGEFSIGIQVGMYDQQFKGSEVYIPDEDDYHESSDDAIPNTDIHGMALDLAAGISYTHRLFYIGLSCTHVTSPAIKLKNENGASSTTTEQEYEFQTDRVLYFTGGCNIPIKNSLFELLPSILVKSDFTFTTGEGTLRARYNKMFSAGLGYRWDDAVYLTLGVDIKNFYIGYSYDYSTSAIARASSGSHEFWLGYSMKLDLSDKNKNKHKSVRIM